MLLARGNLRINYDLFKYIEAFFIATIPLLYHMCNEILQNFNELKVKFLFLNILAAGTSASFLLT